MQKAQNEIKISETETEYLLFIPIYQKDRAKGINGRTWDPERKCWVYPRNIRMYKALIEEFADDLTLSSSFTPPQSFDERETQKEEEQKSELQKEIVHLRQTLSEINATGEATTESIRSLGKMLSTKEDEIQLLKVEGDKKDKKNDEIKRQIAQLQAETKKPSTDIEASFVDTDQRIRDIALEATGNDPVFGEYFKTLDINEGLPIELGKWLEMQLKNTLNSSENLFDLIQQCEDAEIFDRNDISLAHVIRGQRNLILHDSTIDERTKMGRALYCLFAAALLSPKLPEPPENKGGYP
jgi:hypothetical protein